MSNISWKSQEENHGKKLIKIFLPNQSQIE